MFLKTGSRQRKKHNKKIKERNEKKDEKHNKKKRKKRKTKKKNNLKQSSFIEKIFAKSKKKKHIHTERENSEKRETWKHTEIIIKNRKSRNKEEIFQTLNLTPKRDTQRNDKSRYQRGFSNKKLKKS